LFGNQIAWRAPEEATSSDALQRSQPWAMTPASRPLQSKSARLMVGRQAATRARAGAAGRRGGVR